MKIAYAGFDLMYPAMEALSRENELIKLFTCDVDGVYETNDKVIALANSLGIPYTFDQITEKDIDCLIKEGCELLVSAGYYYLIPVGGSLPMVNIHPSLLPYGRGAWPMPLAILDGLKQSGVTVHKTEKDFDTGDILLQKSFDIADDETLESFMDKVNALLPDMMGELTSDFKRLWENARAQGYGEFQTEPDTLDHVIKSTDTAEYADRILRAFYGFPCYYSDGGDTVEIVRKRAFKGENMGEKYPLSDGFIR